jgi:hypothetical protein
MRTGKVPPRPLAPGDIVAAYSDELREWTAAQITDLDPGWGTGTAGVLELDWSGPEPNSADDLEGPVAPLVLSHHAFAGQISHCNYEWLLPRSYKVIGNLPLLHNGKSNSYSSGWRLGQQLDLQRRWDRGDRSSARVGKRTYVGSEYTGLVPGGEPVLDVWSLSIKDIDSLDCAQLAQVFPNLTRLSLSGNLGTLLSASSLNRLHRLKTLFISELFGMTESDCLLPTAAPNLEMLGLYSVPTEYAGAMRKAWTPEIPNGTDVEIRSPRKPGWVAENRDNPLREWDGRDHISTARFRKAVAQYKATRRAIFELLTADGNGEDEAQLTEIGRQFGEAFNQLDGTRNPFIETEEREELFAALDAIVAASEDAAGRGFPSAREHLIAGVESVRNW